MGGLGSPLHMSSSVIFVHFFLPFMVAFTRTLLNMVSESIRVKSERSLFRNEVPQCARM